MQRNATLDILKAIGIILVIIGHNSYGLLFQYIYSFHMPMFFILGGFLYKERDVLQSLVLDFKHLLLPYWVYCITVSVLDNLLYGVSVALFVQDILKFSWGSVVPIEVLGHHIQGVGYLWFLPTLFVTKNLFNVIYKGCKNFKAEPLSMLGLIALSTLLGYLLYHKFCPLPFAITTGLNAVVFFAIGYLAKIVIKDLKTLDNVKWYYWTIIGCIWLFSGKFALNGMGTCEYSFMPLDYLAGVTGTITCYWVSNIIRKNIHLLGNMLAIYGKHTIGILLIHQFINSYAYIFNVENKNIFLIILLNIIVSILYVIGHIIVKNYNLHLIKYKDL